MYGAVKAFRRSVGLDPNEAACHNELMNALMDDEAPSTDVLQEARATARLHPQFTVVFPDVAKWMIETGDKRSAVMVCQEILDAIQKQLPSLGHRCLGLVHWLGEPRETDESVAEFRHAVQVDSRDAAAHHDLGIVLELSGKLEEAVAEYASAADLAVSSQQYKTDYQTALEEARTRRAAAQDGASSDFKAFLDRRHQLEQEIGCDMMVLFPCRNSGTE
jgi:predicted O-linked N-acetylglucosamine transferase (SPINDLY family)